MTKSLKQFLFFFGVFLSSIAGLGVGQHSQLQAAPTIKEKAAETVPQKVSKSTSKRHSQGVESSVSLEECFPLQRLSPEMRLKAEELLLKACDGEALYTVVGGLKPMSSGWVSLDFDPQKPDVAKQEELLEILRHLRCGDEITAHLRHSARTINNRIHLEGVLFSRVGLQRELSTHSSFWHQWAITPGTDPSTVLTTLEYAPSLLRFRGSGYLYGYPEHAVDFFVQGAQIQQENPNQALEREPVHIPTFSRDKNQFVYAVPKGHTFNQADQELRTQCALILTEYKKRRAHFIGEGKPGIVALLRDWFHDGHGRYSPQYARF